MHKITNKHRFMVLHSDILLSPLRFFSLACTPYANTADRDTKRDLPKGIESEVCLKN